MMIYSLGVIVVVTLIASLASLATAHEGCASADPSPAEERMDMHRMQHHQQQRQQQFQQQVASASTRNAARSALCNGCVSVKVVFHLLANKQGTSDATRLWTSQLISDEVVRINQHFASTPFTFQHFQTIVTKNSEWSSTSIENENVVDAMVASLRVGGSDVANIFVTDGTCQTTGGFSSYPRDYGWFPEGTYSMQDRIFMCSDQVGEIVNGYFHTLVTHELGHWFGLRHTYAGRNCDANNENDHVDDTPHHKGRTSNDEGCVASSNTPVNTCPKLPGLDPIKNFMNGAICRDEFTPGQAARMYAQFDAYRRRVEPCAADTIAARFQVRFDSKPDNMQIAFAEYLNDGDRDWTDLKELESEHQVNYANQAFARDLCLTSQTLYTFVVRDVAENGFDSPGFASLSIGGREILRETDFDDEWQSTFVVADACASGRMSLDVVFNGGADEISWEIRDSRGRVVVNRDTTAAYTDAAYRRLYFEKCLAAGEYVFTIYDSAGNGLYNPGNYKLALDGKDFYQGGGDFSSFSSSKSTSFTVSGTSFVGCFSGQSLVTVAGKGSVEMNDLLIGDLVHVGEGKYEPVYSFGHYQPFDRAQFLRIETETMVLEVSEDHLVFTRARGPIPATLLVIGDELLDDRMEAIAIHAITLVTARGVFAPFTPSGKLMVGGVLASSFIALEKDNLRMRIGSFELSHQWVAHTFEFPHRIYCSRNCSGETYDSMGINKWYTSSLRVTDWILEQHTVVRHALLFIAWVLLLLLRFLEAIMCLFNLA